MQKGIGVTIPLIYQMNIHMGTISAQKYYEKVGLEYVEWIWLHGWFLIKTCEELLNGFEFNRNV